MKALKILFTIILFVCSYFGAQALVGSVEVSFAIAALPTQKIVFMTALREEYYKFDTWLEEATDLSAFVDDGQTLRFPEGGADPEVYVDRTTDIDSVEPAETVYNEELSYYDSQNYKIRNITNHALPYNKIQFYTRKSAEAIRKQEIKDAAYNYAPVDDATPFRIIISTTGPLVNGLRQLTLSDVLSLARQLDNAGFPAEGRNLVLPSDMWWDLVENNDILKGQLERQKNDGMIMPMIVKYYGFKIHKSFTDNAEVGYDTVNNVKAPQGSVITGDIVPAGFVFCSTEVYRAAGVFEMFMLEKAKNPTGRADEFGFAHRFKAGFDKSAQRYSAMIYQAKS